jgi:hypothetical protein
METLVTGSGSTADAAVPHVSKHLIDFFANDETGGVAGVQGKRKVDRTPRRRKTGHPSEIFSTFQKMLDFRLPELLMRGHAGLTFIGDLCTQGSGKSVYQSTKSEG